jgi:hypothetical protein
MLVEADVVLTCAHVVSRQREPLRVVRGGADQPAAVAATVERCLPEDGPGEGLYPFPDLALLRLESSLELSTDPLEHGDIDVATPHAAVLPGAWLPGVWFADQMPPPGSVLVGYGYTRYTPADSPALDSLLVTVAGPADRYVRVTSDRVVEGFSGGMVLDEVTGQVCGIVKASRDVDIPQGGWIIPARAVLEHLPQLRAGQERHRPGGLWFDLARDRWGRQRRLFGVSRPSNARTPSGLLVAAAGIVPFVDHPELHALISWCLTNPPDSVVRLLYAEGGTGKTRTARQLCEAMIQEAWIAGFARDTHATELWLAEAVEATAAGFRLLLVVDYAQGLLPFLRQLLRRLADEGAPQTSVRVLLLARSPHPWWEALRGYLDDEAADWAAFDQAKVVELPPLTDEQRPDALAAHAYAAFAAVLGLSAQPPHRLERAVRGLTSALLVHATALDAALVTHQSHDWSETHDPLSRICDHEVRNWRRIIEPLEAFAPDLLVKIENSLVPECILAAPALASGLRRRDMEAALDDVVRVTTTRVPWQTSDARELWLKLHQHYGHAVEDVEPVQPDRVAEILIRRVFRGLALGTSTAYLERLVARARRAGPERLEALFEAWARARGCSASGHRSADDAYEPMDAALRQQLTVDLAGQLPVLVLVAATVPHSRPLAEVALSLLPDCDPPVLAALERALPRYPTELSALAVEVYRRLLGVQPSQTTAGEQARRATLLMRYSARLADIGERRQSLTAAQQGVLFWNDLATRDAAYSATYASSLVDLSARHGDLDERAQALGTCKAAAQIYRRLFEADGSYRIELALCHTNLAVWRAQLEQPVGAYQDALLALELYRSAAADHRQEEGLARCLLNAAVFAHDVGEFEAAVEHAGQAEAMFAELAERDAGRHYVDHLRAAQVLASVETDIYPDRAYQRLRMVVLARQPFLAQRPDLVAIQCQALAQLAATAAEDAPEEGLQWRRILSLTRSGESASDQ